MSRTLAVILVAAVVALATDTRGEEPTAPNAAPGVETEGAQPKPGTSGGSVPVASPATPTAPERRPRVAGSDVPPLPKKVHLSGPRFGFTYLSDGIIRKLQARTSHDFDDLAPVVSQFGWHWERQIGGGTGPVVALTEWVLLVGGLDQSVIIPSLTWLVGVRSQGGKEFGVGPNITPGGTAIALAGGFTIRAGALSFPVNLAVVPSKSGVRVSVLCGFTTR